MGERRPIARKKRGVEEGIKPRGCKGWKETKSKRDGNENKMGQEEEKLTRILSIAVAP